MKRVKKTQRKHKKSFWRKRFVRGSTEINILLVLIIVLMIFLGAFLFQPNGNQALNQGQIPAGVTLPSQKDLETGGGLKTLADITPYLKQFENMNTDCQLLTNDIVLVIDQSGSMRGTKLSEAKVAAQLFVHLIAINPQSRISLVTFDKTAIVRSPLTNNVDTLNSQIDQISSGSNTCIQCGTSAANQQLGESPREGAKRSVVLLSDGKANYIDGKKEKDAAAKAAALQEIQGGFSANSISYYTIAFGKDADADFMREVATSTNGLPYEAVTEDQLTQTFTQAAGAICDKAL